MKIYLQFLLLVLLYSALRLLDVTFFFPFEHANWLLNTLVMGLRFDALILAFVVFVALWVPPIFRVLWGFILLVHLISALAFGVRGESVWLESWQQTSVLWHSGDWFHKALTLILVGGLFVFGNRLFLQIQKGWGETSWKKRIPFLLLLLVLARGSLGKDHLRRNDCDGRPDKTVRSLCMNASYTFMKPRNHEFP